MSILLLFLVGLPTFALIAGAFGLPDAAGFSALAALAGDAENRHALRNTLVLGCSTGALSAVLGVPLAWLVVRTDMPAKQIFAAGAALAYVIPPYLTALAYIALAAPHSGYLNRLTMWLFGAPRGPFDAFSMPGIIAIISLHTFPVTYFLSSTALRSTDASLEEAARLLGAKPMRAFWTVDVPLALPAVSAGVLVAGVLSTALFGPQAFLGIPARIEFLPTRIYGDLQTYPPRFADASALATVLVALTIVGLIVQRALIRRGSYTIEGARPTRTLHRLRAWRFVSLAFGAAVIGAAVVLPVGLLGLLSLSRDWVATLGPAGWTLKNYGDVLFSDPVAKWSIVNSLRFAVVAATVATAIAFLVAYADRRTTVPGRGLLDYLSAVPLGLPGIVFGLAMLEIWIRVPLPVYGTAWILLLAYIARFLPLAVRSASVALVQTGVATEEAGRTAGAGWLHVMRTIVLPLMRPGLLVAWILVFVPAFGDLGTTILLYSHGTETLAVSIYRLQALGRLEAVSALAMLGLAIASLITLVVVRLAGRTPLQLVSS